MILKTNKGFTLIELLVVISIIGLLSSVVLSALNSARSKAANANIKANLNNIRSEAALYCGDGGTLCTAVCSSGNINTMILAARAAGGGTAANSPCNGAASAWAASALLKIQEGTSNYWCVDSTGTSAGRINPLVGSVCPAT